MMVEFSPVAGSRLIQLGDVQAFTAHSIDLSQLGELASPIATLDHYRLRGRPFLPHPHVGFSAIAYVLDDSTTSLRSRDSLGNDLRTDPGGILWTQAAQGMIHEDTTDELDKEMHGIQLFVNLGSANKSLSPRIFQLAGNGMPLWRNDTGDQVRVVTGSYQGLTSPLHPTEAFRFLDATVETRIACDLAADENMVVFVMDGAVRVRVADRLETVESAQAVGLRGGPATVEIEADRPSKLLILSGKPINEPYVRHGNAYIMNSQAQIDDAIARFEAGEMGHVEPRSD